MSGPNARLLEQLQDGFPIDGFIQVASRRSSTHGPERWCFLGLLDILRSYNEPQLDAQGQRRSAWVFELLVHGRPTRILVRDDRQAADVARSTHGNELRPLDREIASSSSSTGDPGHENASMEELEPVRRKLLGMEPRQFELFLRDLLTLSGFSQMEVTRFSQDGGIDVNARPGPQAWPIRQVLIQLQAKRWLHTVDSKEVAELRGSLQAHAAGCIVTTSHFSRAALLEAREPGKIPIQVIDGRELAAWTRQVGYPLD